MYDLAFEPKAEDELIDMLEVGEGNFEVFEATRKESKRTGAPMIEIKLKVWDKNGTQGIIYDYLMLTSEKFSLRKIRHFCFSCGLDEAYNSGKLNASDCVGRQGNLLIGFQKDKSGNYPDKNVANDYIQSNGSEPLKPKLNNVTKEEHFDDDIPF